LISLCAATMLLRTAINALAMSFPSLPRKPTHHTAQYADLSMEQWAVRLKTDSLLRK